MDNQKNIFIQNDKYTLLTFFFLDCVDVNMLNGEEVFLDSKLDLHLTDSDANIQHCFYNICDPLLPVVVILNCIIPGQLIICHVL